MIKYRLRRPSRSAIQALLLLASVVVFIYFHTGNVGPAFGQGAALRLPVPRQTIYPGQLIQPGMLSWRTWRGRGDLANVAQQASDLIGKVARNTLLPNQIIYTATLREPDAVDKGQIVGLHFKINSIEIRGKGIAQQAGAIGSVVRVQNVDTGRLISGTVQSDGSVRVGGEQ